MQVKLERGGGRGEEKGQWGEGESVNECGNVEIWGGEAEFAS